MEYLSKKDIEKIKLAVLANLEAGKAEDIMTFDLTHKSDLCSFVILASGTSDRHVISIAEKLMLSIKEQFKNIQYNAEGLSEGKWVLVDIADIAIHVFHPEVRKYYDLESLLNDPKSRIS